MCKDNHYLLETYILKQILRDHIRKIDNNNTFFCLLCNLLLTLQGIT